MMACWMKKEEKVGQLIFYNEVGPVFCSPVLKELIARKLPRNERTKNFFIAPTRFFSNANGKWFFN